VLQDPLVTGSTITTGPEITAAAANLTGSVRSTLCETAKYKWHDLNGEYEKRLKPDFDAWNKYQLVRLAYNRVYADFFRLCATDEMEQSAIKNYASMVEMGRRSYQTDCLSGRQRPHPLNCEYPPGFHEYFSAHTRNSSIALAWARTAKPAAPPTKEEDACRQEILRWEMLKADRERKLPKDSLVRLSEINLWFMQRSIDTIDRLCPASAKYREQAEVAKRTLPDMTRACSQMASNPPCIARLDLDSKPAPQSQSSNPPSKPSASAPAQSGSGASWAKSTVDACKAQGGTPAIGECIRCDNPGQGWTRCPTGSSGVDSMQ
jgi:hypothetical protein